MSFTRLVYYGALVGGWSAFFGWLIVELLFFRPGGAEGLAAEAIIAALVGSMIAAGLAAVNAWSQASWSRLVFRGALCACGGAIGGALGGGLGHLLQQPLFVVTTNEQVPRALGWMFVGLGIGAVDGIYERASKRIVNGLIGGAVGGLLGGALFDPIRHAVEHGSGMSSRATAFVILGICIGALIGVVQVALKDAWLTVTDGYRAGRQYILTQPVTILGRADNLVMPFLGAQNMELEQQHAKVSRRSDGSFVLEDLGSRIGTRLNQQSVAGEVLLHDGDLIKLGVNFVRFNERQRRGSQAAAGLPVNTTMADNPAVHRAPPPPRKAAPLRTGETSSSAPPPPPRAAKPAPPSAPPAPTPPKPAAGPAGPGKFTPPPPPPKRPRS